jgi:hypothetical protein
MRQIITFDEFKKHFIEQPDGYLTVWAGFDENGIDGTPIRVVQLDMICQWRLTDGKVKFLAVPFETEEQLREIKVYLRVTTALLAKAIQKNISGLSFKKTEEPDEH